MQIDVYVTLFYFTFHIFHTQIYLQFLGRPWNRMWRPTLRLSSQPESTATAIWLALISHPTIDRRMGWPEWSVTYQDGIPLNGTPLSTHQAWNRVTPLPPVVKVRRNAVEPSSGTDHFELIEFRCGDDTGTFNWPVVLYWSWTRYKAFSFGVSPWSTRGFAPGPAGGSVCPQAQTPIIAPRSPSSTVPSPPKSYFYHWLPQGQTKPSAVNDFIACNGATDWSLNVCLNLSLFCYYMINWNCL